MSGSAAVPSTPAAVAQTVAGLIDPDALGPTSMHEHVLTVGGETWRRRHLKLVPNASDELWEEPVTLERRGGLELEMTAQRANLTLDDDEVAAAELRELREAGGRTVVDVGGIGLRGDVRRVAAIAEAAGVNVVMSTGFYCSDFCPPEHEDKTVEQLTALLVRELTEGIDATGIRAGHIKCGVTSLDAREHRQLLAAAHAAQATGASVTVHPGFGIGGDGRRIARILIEAGLDPSRIVLAHADAFVCEHDLKRLVSDPSAWAITLDYHREVLSLGVTTTFDCFGHGWSKPAVGFVLESDWQRLAGVVALVREGHASQLALGTDVFMPILTRRGGGYGYRHLWANVLPWLRAVEVSDWDIEQMTVVNPRRLLTVGAAA